MTLGTRVVDWVFIVAEISEDKGILGNDFAMAQELTVRPHEGAVYLLTFSSGGKEDMGERLPCAVWLVAEVTAITEEVHAVRALRTITLAPRTVSQVSIIVPTLRPGERDGGSWGTSAGIVHGTRGDRGGTGQ